MLNTAIIISAFAFSLSRLIILRQNTDESEKLVTATSLRNPHFFLLVEASLAVSSNQATWHDNLHITAQVNAFLSTVKARSTNKK